MEHRWSKNVLRVEHRDRKIVAGSLFLVEVKRVCHCDTYVNVEEVSQVQIVTDTGQLTLKPGHESALS